MILESFELYQKFQKIIQNKKISHLYLIEGNKNLNKKELVIKISYEILKIDNQNLTLEQLITTNIYPNFYYLTNNDSLIKKEDILNLKFYFLQKPLLYKKRVFVIEDINQMTYSASNILLNFLENQFNQNTHGFLLSDDLSQVLPTILSRCQVFRLSFSYIVEEQKKYLLLKEEGFEFIDCFLISLIKQERINLIFFNSSYYINFKKTFLNIIEGLQKSCFLRTIFINCPILKEKNGWFRDLSTCLLKYFIVIFYKKTNIDYFYNSEIPDIFLIDFSIKNLNMIINLIINLQKKEKYLLNDEDLFMTLLIGFDDICFKK
ncbi:MAG: hypothetical protein ACLTFB_00065 [Candidatus Phytoplasma pyri]|uniref:hypothetical protein n=1 Tax=Candidatus Phytoplasma pyri TaxID=47566 RepID=UPI00398319AA